MSYIRQPLKNIPIRYKTIKGKEYAYQRVRAWRDPVTGQVKVQDRHLGPRKPARPKPLLDQLDQTDIDIITDAWQRGEDVDWIRMYVKTVLKDEPSPATVYNWFRAQGITRGKRTTKRAEKRITAADARIERLKRIRAEDRVRKAQQARHRKKARSSMESEGLLISLIDDAAVLLA